MDRENAKLVRTEDCPTEFYLVLETGKRLQLDKHDVRACHHIAKRWLTKYQSGLNPKIPGSEARFPAEYTYCGWTVRGIRMSNFPEIDRHVNRYDGGKALIVLGGQSGERWEAVAKRIKPDVVIGVNGVNAHVPLDYWIIVEGGTCKNLSTFQDMSPLYRLVHSFGFEDLRDKTNAIQIMRVSDIDSKTQELEENLLSGNTRIPFDIRKYGLGLLGGDLMKHTEALQHDWQRHRCGTVAVQAIHWAGILGVSEIHTIGLDLCFKHGFDGEHHWYPDRQYTEENKFWQKGMFFRYKRLATSWFWFESAEYILKLNRLVLEPAGIKFVDHSRGMIRKLGYEKT